LVTIEQIFRPRKNVADTVLQQTLQVVADSLGKRGQAKRSQARDNEIFGPVTAAMIETFNAGEVHLAIKLADGCHRLAKQHEAVTGSEIHKGAITFDLGLMYLAIDDYTAAARYFEIAEHETRATEKAEHPDNAESSFTLFRSRVFELNVWDRIADLAAQYPLAGYKELWGTNYDKAAARADWEKLSDNSKLLYVITALRRMRYRELSDSTTWTGASSLHLAHWNLSADLSRVVETELKRRKQCPPPKSSATKPISTLGQLLDQCFHHTTKPANLSQLQIALHAKHKVTDSATFDSAFPAIRKEIEQATAWEDRVANAVYVLRAARNQVAHSVDDSMLLFKDPSAATFVVDVLLSLCRVGDWTN
jgi:hypothetical protein